MSNMRLRRSFSLDFVNDDAATIFLTGDNGESSTSNITSTVANDSKAPLQIRSFQLHSNGASLALNSSPNTCNTSSNNAVVSPSMPWHESPDIDDALAADFDGSLSGLGMEVGTSSYNMSDALLALPILKNEHTNHKGIHSRSDSHPPYLGYHGSSQHHSHSHSQNSHHHHISHSDDNHPHLQSICNSSSTNGHGCHIVYGSSPNDEHRPVAIVHGKKNRLALGHDDESSVSTAIKRVCINNDRESSQENSRFSINTLNSNSNTRDSAGGDSSGTECNHEDCDSPLRCSKHSSSAPDLRPHHSSESSPSPSSSSVLTHILNSSSSSTSTGPISVLPQHATNLNAFTSANSSTSHRKHHQANANTSLSSCLFQYTLGAPTSVATKLHEETMTYLNQGQPYEIKLKQISDTSTSNSSKFKSVIRVGFHERRLQYKEKELIDQWRDQRQERILEIDVPLSYGINDIICDPMDINRCSFVWDSGKDAGIFIKVNCISTEFTPKKHGGEKGVPFRLIIETYACNSHSSSSTTTSSSSSSYSTSPGNPLLHAASSQVKVFKPKGADRKHKTDREKMMRRSDQEKFRTSNDITVFTDCPLDQLFTSPSLLTSRTLPVITSNNGTCNSSGTDSSLDKMNSHLKREVTSAPSSCISPSPGVMASSKSTETNELIAFTGHRGDAITCVTDDKINQSNGGGTGRRSLSNGTNGNSMTVAGGAREGRVSGGSNGSSNLPSVSPPSSLSTDVPQQANEIVFNGTGHAKRSATLTCESTSDETVQWLALNRFERFHKIFTNFSGADILRLSRDDLTMLCGLSDGIRLYNCLHCINIRPRLTIYVNCGNDEDFSALYLDNLTVSELKSKLRNLLMCSYSSNNCNGHSPSSYNINRIRIAAPQSGIYIAVTDDVVRNISCESMFLVNFDKEGTSYRATMHHFKT